MGMDVDGQGRLVVAQQNPCKVEVMSPCGEIYFELGQTPAGGEAEVSSAVCETLMLPSDVAVGRNGDIYVVDTGHNRIAVFSGVDGRFLRTWGHLGYEAVDELYYPMGITVHNEEVYVADAGNGRVMVYATDGRFLRQISGRGIGADEFDSPFDVAVDGAGRVWVADNGLQKLVVFGPDSAYLGAYGMEGDRTAFEDLTSLYAGEDGTVVIADGYTGRAFAVQTGITFARVFDGAAPVKALNGSLADAKMAFGPVPARAGEAMVMSLPFRADSVQWEVVSLDMRTVAGGDARNTDLASMGTQSMDSGIYLVRSTVKFAGESRSHIQKIVITR
jgi:hypothetical protein